MGAEMPEENEQDTSATENTTQHEQETDDQQDTGADTDTGTDWEAEMKKWRALARKHEQAAKANASKATAWDKAEAANKTELDRLKDDLTAREVELTELRVADVRRKAALNAGLDAEMAEFITAADDVEALEQAQKLAKRLVPAQNTTRRTGDLRQGTRGENATAEVSRDDILRGWAGVTG